MATKNGIEMNGTYRVETEKRGENETHKTTK